MSWSILWLVPNKPDNISVHSERITTHIEAAGHEVTLQGVSVKSVIDLLTDCKQYDLVLGTTRLGAIVGGIISQVHKIPLIVEHIDPIRQLHATESDAVVWIVRRLEHIAFRLADHVLYVYSEEESRLQNRSVASTKTTLGVDFNRFANPDPAVIDQARDRLGTIPENLAVYIGGLEPIYSIESLLAAAQQLDDWTLLIIGAGSLKPAVEEATNSGAVRFLGTVPHEEIPGYLHIADVGVCLVDDPHTLKVLEYGAAGLNTVHLAGRAESRYGGLVEYCTTEPAAIAEAIKRAEKADCGRALQKYVKRFDWAAVTESYLQAITTIK